jgi:hypothetical protein
MTNHVHIHAIREALNQEWVLGREDFKDKIERMSNDKYVRVSQGAPVSRKNKPYIVCSSILAESVF